MFRSLALLLSLAALSLSACDGSVSAVGGGGEGGGAGEGGVGGGSACTLPAAPPTFAIGTGELCFETIEPGAVVPVVSGPQGGYHVWLAIGCVDCGAQVEAEWEALDPTTMELLPGAFWSLEIVELAGSWPSAAGLIVSLPGVVWDPETPPPAKGTRVLLHVKTTSPAHEATLEVELGDLVEWDPCAEDPNHPACGFG
jgi:hypothetical protein